MNSPGVEGAGRTGCGGDGDRSRFMVRLTTVNAERSRWREGWTGWMGRDIHIYVVRYRYR